MDVRFVAADVGIEALVALGVVLAGIAFIAMRIAKGRRAEREKLDREEPAPERPETPAREAEEAREARVEPEEEKAEPEEKEKVKRAEAAPPEGAEEEPAPPEAREAEGKREEVAAEKKEAVPAPPPEKEPPEDEADRAAREAAREELRRGLATTRGGLLSRIGKVLRGRQELDPALLAEIEEVFITSDIGVRTTQALVERMKDRLGRKELHDPQKVWSFLRDEATRILSLPAAPPTMGNPHVVMVVGVNGVGKTTTIGKLASRYQAEGKKAVLAAADTFRAAAVAQLEVWGRRVGCPVVKGKDNADPASVVFDAIKSAQTDGADYVVADTAGRLHTKVPLMEELKKVRRVIGKAQEGAPHEVLLVLDATTGQNAIAQTQMFKEALGITGIVLTKLDGTAKGGVILGICDEHAIPIRYIGIGEKVEDLREFSAPDFVDALLYRAEEDSLAA